MIILAMTGASGVIYGERILKALRGAGVRVGLMITDTAREIIRYELEMEPGALRNWQMSASMQRISQHP